MPESIAVIPSSGNRAIEVMAFGLEFDRQIDSKAINAVEAHYDQSDSLKVLLPKYEKLNGITVCVGGKSQSVNVGNNGLRISKKEGEKTPAKRSIYDNAFRAIEGLCQSPLNYSEHTPDAPGAAQVEAEKAGLLKLATNNLPEPKTMLLEDGTLGAFWYTSGNR